MTDRSHHSPIAESSSLRIPRSVRPRHRQSWPELAGRLFRGLTGSLTGPKGFVFGLFAMLVAVGGGSYLQGALSGDRPAVSTTAESAAPSQTERPLVSPDPIASDSILSNPTITPTAADNTLTFTGTLVPESLLRIAPPVTGLQILEMRAEVGDRVTAGQVLATLDDSVLQAQLNQAQADLAQAKTSIQSQTARLSQAQVLQEAAIADVNRYRILHDQGAISQVQLNDVKMQLSSAAEGIAVSQAELASARATIASRVAEIDRLQTLISQTIVAAPATGTIAERLATVGDTATATTPVYSLIEADQLVLEIRPLQGQLSQLEVGMPVDITPVESIAQNQSPSASSSARLQGRIDTIEPMLDASSREGVVKVALPNDAKLRPGMFLQAEVITGTR